MSARVPGTYSSIDNEVIEYALRQHNARGAVLLALARQRNYSQEQGLSVPALMLAAGLRERAVELALTALTAEGWCVREGQSWRYLCANERANESANESANENAKNFSQISAENDQKNAVQDGKKEALKEIEGNRRNKNKRKQQKDLAANAAVAPPQKPRSKKSKPKTPLASQDDLTVAPHEGEQAIPPQEESSGAAAAAAGGAPKKPTSEGFPWFEAVCLACYGTTKGLTKVAGNRAGASAKSLRAAGYAPEEIGQMAAWVREKDPWRTDLSPQTLEGEAPKWRARQEAAPAAAPAGPVTLALPGGGYYDARADKTSDQYDPRFDPASDQYDPAFILSA